MSADSDDLLIFKMRGMKKQGEKKPEEPGKEAPAAKAVQQEQARPAAPAQVQKNEEVQAQQAPQQQEIAQARAQPGVQEQPQQRQAGTEEKAVVQQVAQEEVTKPYMSHGEDIQKFLSERVEEQQEVQGKKLTKKEKGNIKAARGMNCVNHPWRPAYSMCEYCKRPFCYADLISYGKNFYCLEDIDKVSSRTAKEARKVPKMLLNAIGMLFLASAGLLAYFVWPQAQLLYLQITSQGLGLFLATLNYNYVLQLINVGTVLFGFIAAVMIFVKHDNGLFVAGSIAAVTVMIVSYEYLNTDTFYLAVVGLLEILNIAVLAYGRMNMVEASYEKEVEPMDIDWPGIETY